MENNIKKQELNLKVGNYYQRANGEIVLIVDRYKKSSYFDTSCRNYYSNGICKDAKSIKKDLIRGIPKELMTYLKIKIEEFETKPSFRNFVERVGK